MTPHTTVGVFCGLKSPQSAELNVQMISTLTLLSLTLQEAANETTAAGHVSTINYYEPVSVCRFYLQLPTERAHLYHTVDTPTIPPPPPDLSPPPTLPQEEEEEEEAGEQVGKCYTDAVDVIRKLFYRCFYKSLRRFEETWWKFKGPLGGQRSLKEFCGSLKRLQGSFKDAPGSNSPTGSSGRRSSWGGSGGL